ncbi:MAG: sugar porter family MFS transporter [Pirellulales bacterium]|nr:sugar porter family MFS transporter [Pirellulales bacterium]
MSADFQPAPTTALPLRGSVRYLIGICLVASLGGFLFGFDTAVISGTVERVVQQYQLSDYLKGWFTSSALVGCIAGAAAAGALGDRFGRKPILLVAAAFFFASALYSCIPPNFTVLIAARILGGLGVGMASVLAPMFISEFAPPRWRGRLVAFYQLSIVLGILGAYLSNYLLLSFSTSSPAVFGGQGRLHEVMIAEVWRGMFGAEMIPAAGFFLLLLHVPESPRWLAQKGRGDRALGILARIVGRDDAQRQMAEIQTALGREEGRFRELFKPGLRLALLVGVMLSVFGQFSGVNIIIYYGPEILKAAGYRDATALLVQVGIGIINLVFTVLALMVIDRWGRRPLLIKGMAAVTVCLVVIGALFFFGGSRLSFTANNELQGTVSAALGPAILVVLCAYMACLAFSICAVIWVLTPEIFPNRIRGRAASAATFANWSANAFSAYIFPTFVRQCGMYSGFFTAGAICLVATLFFWKFVPETKGKSLEEIERHWTAPGAP